VSLDQNIKKKRGRPPKKKESILLKKKVKTALKTTELSTSARNQTSIPFFVWLNAKIKILTGKFRKTA